MKRTIRIIIFLSPLILLFIYWSLPGSLPASSETNRFSVKLADRNGLELRNIPSGKGNRGEFLPLESFPTLLIEGIIAAEDRRFYRHPGVDWRALLRAAWQNTRSGRSISGASTIPMQAARLAWDFDRSLTGKFMQMGSALKISRRHSKGEILEFYLNHLPFGGTVGGAAEACRFYFRGECGRLSPAQLATLAVLPRSPNLLRHRPDLLEEKRNTLLTRIFETGAISKDVFETARLEPLSLAPRGVEFYAPHFTERVKNQTPLATPGTVRTSLDRNLQRDVQLLTRYHVDRLRDRNVNAASVLVVDNNNGEILAYVGSPDYFDDENKGKVDYIQTLRQPGSTVKPFTYALALRSGQNLATLVPDLPLVFSTKAGPYRPRNYSGVFTGPRRIREALANSLNVPALYTASELGDFQLVGWFRRFGFDSLDNEPSFYGPGLTLGNGEVSLWDLTRAYMTIARGGTQIPLSLFHSGKTWVGGRKIMDPRVAYLIAEVLSDPLARESEFGRYNDLTFTFPVGAKTGTSTDYRDNWVVGFTRDVTVGVWVGNDANRPMKRVTGMTGASPLFHQVMSRIHQSRAPKWNPRPAGLVEKDICPLSGKLVGEFCEGSYTEFFREEHVPTEFCQIHQAILVQNCRGRTQRIEYVDLPPAYQEWENTRPSPTLPQLINDHCGNSNATIIPVEAGKNKHYLVKGRILEPKEGSFYAIDPTIPPEYQKLPVRFLHPNKHGGAELYINGLLEKVVDQGQGIYLWEIQRGKHTFQVKFLSEDGSKAESENVTIQVF